MRHNLPILLVCLAALYYLAAGTYKASHFSADFIPVYSGARCFLHGCNPYDPAEMQAEHLRTGGKPPRMTNEYWASRNMILLYPPSTLLVLSPLTLFSFPVSAVLWALLGGGLFLAAIGLVLSACPQDYFWLAAILASIFLVVDSPSLLGTGNPATFACALAMAGAMFFLRNRNIPLAVVLLTLSVTIKPQVGGLIVLYFFVRKIHWRGAAIVLGASFVILLLACSALELRASTRNWMPMLRADIAGSVQPGQVDDPTPANIEYGDLINLQTITSVFIANPKGYNAVAWSIFLALLTVWMCAVRTTNAGRTDHFFALPPLLVLSLLPVYHRGCDDLLLILAIPMILTVMQRHRVLGSAMATATALPHLLVVVIPKIMSFVDRFWNAHSILNHKLVFILLLRYQCPVLLLIFGLYMAGMFTTENASDAASTVAHGEAYSM